MYLPESPCIPGKVFRDTYISNETFDSKTHQLFHQLQSRIPFLRQNNCQQTLWIPSWLPLPPFSDCGPGRPYSSPSLCSRESGARKRVSVRENRCEVSERSVRNRHNSCNSTTHRYPPLPPRMLVSRPPRKFPAVGYSPKPDTP